MPEIRKFKSNQPAGSHYYLSLFIFPINLTRRWNKFTYLDSKCRSYPDKTVLCDFTNDQGRSVEKPGYSQEQRSYLRSRLWAEKAVNQKHANGAALVHSLASSSSCGFNISGLNCPDWFAKKYGCVMFHSAAQGRFMPLY